MFELYSERMKKEKGELVDVYQYTEFNEKFKNQVLGIICDAIGDEDDEEIELIHKKIYGKVRRRHGMEFPKFFNSYYQELSKYFVSDLKYEKVLDITELWMREIDLEIRGSWIEDENELSSEEAIEELNHIFKMNGIGYQYENGMIMRIDDELVHQEAVKPAIQFLNEEGFEGAREEFLEAFDEYKRKKYKDALVKCLKSMESTLKAIFEIKGWKYKSSANAKALIKVAFDNKLIPEFWENHFGYLDKLLECSIPVGRNKLGGHGQGSDIVEVPEEIVSYMLHMTASTIVFLAKASK